MNQILDIFQWWQNISNKQFQFIKPNISIQQTLQKIYNLYNQINIIYICQQVIINIL